MSRTHRIVAALLAAVVSSGAHADPLLELGGSLSRQFRAGEVEPLWERLTPAFRQSLGGAGALAEIGEGVRDSFGEETGMRGERVDRVGRAPLYQRLAAHERGVLLTQMAFDGEQNVSGFVVRAAPEAAPSQFEDYRTKAELRLPFDGEWTVYWGGRDVLSNYHVVDPAQRYAADFVVMRDGASHAGDGARPQDYHCWGEPILAPADALVARVVADLPDQQIGATDTDNPAGNHVVLDLGSDEYLFLAHLQQGSIEVAEGDAVLAGAQIARCGNSGNSSEPHLHVHMQTTADLAAGEGLPAAFSGYVADGARVQLGEPLRGQAVKPADGQ